MKDDPAMIDAKYFSPQKRSRYFWSNIPGLYGISNFLNDWRDEIDTKYDLQAFLTPHLGRQATVKCIRTVTTHTNSLIQKGYTMPVIESGRPSTLMGVELERIFGFPEHYTRANSFRETVQLLGKSWSVPVIQAILYPLKYFFESK